LGRQKEPIMATTALTDLHTNARRDELLEFARRQRPVVGPQPLILDGAHAVTIRYAGGADIDAVSALAELDDGSIAGPEILIAEVGGAIVAALALTGGTVVADPFRRTSAAVGLLRLRAEQLNQTTRPRRLPRLLRRALPV
jgi:hypothetical protein